MCCSCRLYIRGSSPMTSLIQDTLIKYLNLQVGKRWYIYCSYTLYLYIFYKGVSRVLGDDHYKRMSRVTERKCGTLKNQRTRTAKWPVPGYGQNLQPFTGNGDVSIWPQKTPNKQTNKQTDTQTDTQTDKHTDRQTDRQTDNQRNKQTNKAPTIGPMVTSLYEWIIPGRGVQLFTIKNEQIVHC